VTRLSVAVMAHPSREHWVADLLGRLGISDWHVAWDRGLGIWDTCSRAWSIYDSAATHHLVLQDDALVCRDLLPGLEAAIDTRSPFDNILSLYVGTPHPGATGVARVRQHVTAADEAGSSWFVLPTLRWGLAVVLPTHVIDQMLAWELGALYPADDQRIGRFARDQLGWRCWHTWPSLVDHRQGPSLVGSGETHAYRFIGEGASALQWNWDGPVTGRRR
jgi:hypothetical protein